MDKDLSISARRRAEKIERNQRKKKLLDAELAATRPVRVDKGQWQFPAACFLTQDYQSFCVIPYGFFGASKSHSSFRSQLYKAAQCIKSTLVFGTVVGGAPLIYSEQAKAWVKKSKKSRAIVRFWSRGALESSDFVKRPIRTALKADEDCFKFTIDDGCAISPGTSLMLSDGCITSDKNHFDLKIKIHGRAIAFCINRFEEGAKSICFGLVPYPLINEEFVDHYTKAFDLLGRRLGTVRQGFIVEIGNNKLSKKKLFATLTVLDDQRIKILFYDFKSPVNPQLCAYLARKTAWKTESWHGKRGRKTA